MALANWVVVYVFAIVLAGVLCSADINTTIPILVPPSSQPLSQNLLSFSIEQDRWPDWTGISARNEFTHSALIQYASLTGKPTRIRVGANSEDRTVWSPTVTVSTNVLLFNSMLSHALCLGSEIGKRRYSFLWAFAQDDQRPPVHLLIILFRSILTPFLHQTL